jgi:hypothetical protein
MKGLKPRRGKTKALSSMSLTTVLWLYGGDAKADFWFEAESLSILIQNHR